MGPLLPLTVSASKHSAKVCASLATWRVRTSSWNTDMRRQADESPKLAAELVSLKVDLIVAGGGSGLARAVKETTKTIPIVMNRR